MVQISPKYLHLLEPHNIELIPIIWNTSFNQPVKISIASFQLVPIYISIYSFVIRENIEKISMFCVLIIAALVSFASAAPARPICNFCLRAIFYDLLREAHHPAILTYIWCQPINRERKKFCTEICVIIFSENNAKI